MSAFTLAYLARVELWALLAAAAQGGLVWGSWLAWKRAAVAARHRLACAHFAALLLLPALTLAILLSGVAEAGAPRGPAPPAADLSAFAEGHAPTSAALALAVLWLAGAAVMLLKLGVDALRIARLPRFAAPKVLAETVQRLAHGGLVPRVRVAPLASPQVVGLLRPVLLAPADLHLRLPKPELEAVLLHEIAHVRRHDFAWNLLQRLALALVWFHPAAWALYGELSREREASCDRSAIGRGADRFSLARALVRLAETRAAPALAMPAAASSHLTLRVHRLLGPGETAPTAAAWASALAASALCLAGLGAGRLASTDPAIADLYQASAFGPVISIAARDPAGAFAVRIHEGRVIEASVDRRRLPPAGIRQRGEQVVLLGERAEPLLALTVLPQGRITWEPRS